MKLVLPALAAAAFLALCLPTTTVSAAPFGAAPIAQPETGVQPAQSMRRRRMMRRSMGRRSIMRRRGISRMSAPSQAGNARNPSRPVMQQQQGQTTGGPRY